MCDWLMHSAHLNATETASAKSFKLRMPNVHGHCVRCFQAISACWVPGQANRQTSTTTQTARACVQATPQGASASRATSVLEGLRNPLPAWMGTTVTCQVGRTCV